MMAHRAGISAWSRPCLRNPTAAILTVTGPSTNLPSSPSSSASYSTHYQRPIYLATPRKEELRIAKARIDFPQTHGSSKYPATKPPSHKPGELERSQLLRRYISLIRSSPLMLVFQHNNLTAGEWLGVRNELAAAMEAADIKAAAAAAANSTTTVPLAASVRVSVVKASLLSQAFRLVDFYNPEQIQEASRSVQGLGAVAEKVVEDEIFTHYLSTYARDSVKEAPDHPLKPLLSGPISVLAFPVLSPLHIEAAIRILAPEAPKFSAPRRRERPSLYEPAVQNGLQKIMLLGGRVWEWKQTDANDQTSATAMMMTKPQVLDPWEARWLAGLKDRDSLRAELVALLNLPAVGLVSALSAPATSLWATLESHKQESEKGEEKTEVKEGGAPTAEATPDVPAESA